MNAEEKNKRKVRAGENSRFCTFSGEKKIVTKKVEKNTHLLFSFSYVVERTCMQSTI